MTPKRVIHNHCSVTVLADLIGDISLPNTIFSTAHEGVLLLLIVPSRKAPVLFASYTDPLWTLHPSFLVLWGRRLRDELKKRRRDSSRNLPFHCGMACVCGRLLCIKAIFFVYDPLLKYFISFVSLPSLKEVWIWFITYCTLHKSLHTSSFLVHCRIFLCQIVKHAVCSRFHTYLCILLK